MRQIHSHGGQRGGGGLFRDSKADCVSVLLNLGLNKNRRKSNWEKYSPDAAWLALSPPSVSAEIKWTVAASHTFSQSSASLSLVSLSCCFFPLWKHLVPVWISVSVPAKLMQACVCVSTFLSASLKFDECLYIAVNGDGEEGEDELRRKIYVMRKMLEVLFGMVTLSSSLMRREWVADDPPLRPSSLIYFTSAATSSSRSRRVVPTGCVLRTRRDERGCGNICSPCWRPTATSSRTTRASWWRWSQTPATHTRQIIILTQIFTPDAWK